MKKVIVSVPVVNALQALDESERKKAKRVIHRLAASLDPERIKELNPEPGRVYSFTSNELDFRIFFEIDSPAQQVTVLDIAKPSRFGKYQPPKNVIQVEDLAV